MATEAQLIEALRRADAAGNADDAQKIADAIRAARSGKRTPLQKVGAFVLQKGGEAARLGGFPGAAFLADDDIGRATRQGATFGYADELAGLIGGDPEKIRSRAQHAAFRKAHPVAATAAEVIGGGLVGGIAGGAKALAGKPLGEKVLRGLAIGAGEGAAYGAGTSEGGIKERTPDAIKGGGFGAGFGAAFPVLAQGIGAFWRRSKGGEKVTDAGKRAYRVLRRSLASDLGGIRKAEDFIDRWMKRGGDPQELFDNLGPTSRELAREMAAREPTKALRFIGRVKDAQADEIRYQVGGRLNEMGKTTRQTARDLKEIREVQAAPFFERARKQRVFSSELGDLIEDRPSIRSAIAEATRNVKDRGNTVKFSLGNEGNDADRLLEMALDFRKAKTPPKAKSLAQYMVERGGLRDPGGDIRAMMGGVRGRPGLLNNAGGKQVDDAIVDAVEQGYFPEANLDQGILPSQREFFDALSSDLRGQKRFRGVDHELVQEAADISVMDEQLTRLGVDPNATRDELIRQVEEATGEKISAKFAPTMEVLMRAKGELDDQIGSHLRFGRDERAGDLIAAKNALVERLDELVPEYAEGRAIFAGTKKIDDAMKAGRDFLNPKVSAGEITDQLATMSESEREFYKVAVTEAFDDLIDRTKDHLNPSSFIATKKMRAKIRALFADDPQEAEDLIRLVKKSEERFGNLSFIAPTTGSQTELRQRARQAFESEVAGPLSRRAADILDNPLTAPKRAARGLNRRRIERMEKSVSDVLSEALFERQPKLRLGAPSEPFGIPYRPVPALNPVVQNRE